MSISKQRNSSEEASLPSKEAQAVATKYKYNVKHLHFLKKT